MNDFTIFAYAVLFFAIAFMSSRPPAACTWLEIVFDVRDRGRVLGPRSARRAVPHAPHAAV